MPEVLSELPVDPTTALPFGYRPEDTDGYPFVLYSYGRDCVDDTGEFRGLLARDTQGTGFDECLTEPRQPHP